MLPKIWRWGSQTDCPRKTTFKKPRLIWVKILSLSIYLKVSQRKLDPWFVIQILFLWRSAFISIHLLFSLAWNFYVIPGLALLVAIWIYWRSYRKRYLGLLVLYLLLHLNLLLVAKMWSINYLCKKLYLRYLAEFWICSCILLSTNFLYTFREGSFTRKNMEELRNEFLQIFGETSLNRLSLLPNKVFI